MLRVLHMTDRLSGRGGADLLLASLIAALAELGVMQHLLVGRRDIGAAVHCPVTTLSGLDDSRAAAAPVGLALAIARYAPDLIHLHNALGAGTIALVADHGGLATVQDHRSFCPGQGKLTLAGAICTEPMSPTLCSACFSDERYGEAIYRITDKRRDALGRMRRLIVLSDYMRYELVQAGIAAERITVVQPAIRSWPAMVEAERDCILFCGRLVRAKGVLDAIEVYERAAIALPLRFVGTGPLRADIERRGYQVLGWRDQQELGALYARARVLLMPSRWQEPYGVVGREAQSCGVAVVAWNSGGISQWHAADEWLVPWGDLDAMASALRHAVSATAAAPEPRSLPSEAELTLALYHSMLGASDSRRH